MSASHQSVSGVCAQSHTHHTEIYNEFFSGFLRFGILSYGVIVAEEESMNVAEKPRGLGGRNERERADADRKHGRVGVVWRGGEGS